MPLLTFAVCVEQSRRERERARAREGESKRERKREGVEQSPCMGQRSVLTWPEPEMGRNRGFLSLYVSVYYCTRRALISTVSSRAFDIEKLVSETETIRHSTKST